MMISQKRILHRVGSIKLCAIHTSRTFALFRAGQTIREAVAVLLLAFGFFTVAAIKGIGGGNLRVQVAALFLHDRAGAFARKLAFPASDAVIEVAVVIPAARAFALLPAEQVISEALAVQFNALRVSAVAVDAFAAPALGVGAGAEGLAGPVRRPLFDEAARRGELFVQNGGRRARKKRGRPVTLLASVKGVEVAESERQDF